MQNYIQTHSTRTRQIYLYSTFHTQWQFKVIYIEIYTVEII